MIEILFLSSLLILGLLFFVYGSQASKRTKSTLIREDGGYGGEW